MQDHKKNVVHTDKVGELINHYLKLEIMKVELSNEEIIALRIAITKSSYLTDISERRECNTTLSKAYITISHRIRELCDEVWKMEAEEYNHKH